MSMSFTESQKALISEIFEKKFEQHSLNAKENNRNLTDKIDKLAETMEKAMDKLSAFMTSQFQKELESVKSHFNSEITLMIQERKNDIKTLESNHKLCRVEHDQEIKEVRKELKNLKEEFGKLPETFITKNESYRMTLKGMGIVFVLIIAPIIVGVAIWWFTER